MGGAWFSKRTHREPRRVFNALLRYLDTRLFAGDLIYFASSSMAQAASPFALAKDVRTVHIFLRCFTCVDLGMVGSEF